MNYMTVGTGRAREPAFGIGFIPGCRARYQFSGGRSVEADNRCSCDAYVTGTTATSATVASVIQDKRGPGARTRLDLYLL